MLRSGARKSCETEYASASSSCAAARSRSSFCIRSVKSRVTFANPTRGPLSRSAVITTFAQKRVPALRTRQPTPRIRPPRATHPPVARRPLELARRFAARDIFGSVEHGEMAADDLVRAILLEALGAGIPARDVGFRVARKGRVVPDALDDEPKALRGLGRVHEIHGVTLMN